MQKNNPSVPDRERGVNIGPIATESLGHLRLLQEHECERSDLLLDTGQYRKSPNISGCNLQYVA